MWKCRPGSGIFFDFLGKVKENNETPAPILRNPRSKFLIRSSTNSRFLSFPENFGGQQLGSIAWIYGPGRYRKVEET